MDETPATTTEETVSKPVGLAQGVSVAYDLPVSNSGNSGPTVQDTDISLEQLMAQMKKM